ncbi:MAG: acyl carrier protein [Bryobacteraceae bacterium]|jgi:acyl carrier protein
MKPTQPEILAYVLHTVQGLCQDWDYADPVGPESLLFTGLGMESLDAVVLCTAIQEHYQTTMPFAELLADIGQKQRDLSIAELADFVAQHVCAAVQEPKPEHQAVETCSPRRIE